MPFVPHTEQDIQRMLETIGVASIDALFDEIPSSLRIQDLPEVPSGLSEMAASKLFNARASQDQVNLNFIGAGAYEHYIPAAVWQIAARGEFMTAYTPYQAEASQGSLQVIYEFQTMMTRLTGLEVANASMYDGATALAEACLMAARLQRKIKAHRILVPKTLHPHYRDVLQTLLSCQDIEVIEIDYDRDTGLTDLNHLNSFQNQAITALVIPQPNFFGRLEPVDALTDWAHDNNAMAIAVVNPVAMAWLQPPGRWGEQGVDIACGEGQPLGIPMASGGPYYGFMCCREAYVRQMPGRIVGQTLDLDGSPGFTLTLQAREQHIRRAKATSNICTNQGLMVTASTIFMAMLGPEGLQRIAKASHHNTIECVNKLTAIKSIKQRFPAPFFHECVLTADNNIDELLGQCADQDILAGYALGQHYPELDNAWLLCCTETKTEQDIATLQQQIAKVVE